MKLKTAILTIFSLSLLLLFKYELFAEEIPPKEQNINVNANIQIDLYSTLSLSPQSVQISQPSAVEVRIISPDGQPVANHTVVITATGTDIVQPVLPTDLLGRTTGYVSAPTPGTYTICAKDVTFGYDINIQTCKTLYVTILPIPKMFSEPEYTRGNSNLVLWGNLGTGYTYTVQASTDAFFENIVSQGVSVNGTSYEFKNLLNEQMYFYRVKARNAFGGESSWSDTVFSVQDSEYPTVQVLDISDTGENTTVRWDNDFIVTISLIVSDNLELESKEFTCLKKDGSLVNCSSSSTDEGDNWIINIRLDALERVSGVYLYGSYRFCVKASDEAGNTSNYCDITLNFLQGDTPGEEEYPPKPLVIDRIDKGIEDINEVLDNTVGNLEQDNLETVNTTTSIVTASTAITIAAGTLWEIPYFLTQFVLSLLSWLGFRKRGKPFGFVYDSVTKEPISQAIVRVFDENNKMVWSDVTDSNGAFTVSLEEGRYKIKVRSSKYSFPSNVVFGREDYPISNIYHGESFESNETEDIKFAIPIDPLELSKFRLFVEGILGRFKYVINILHVILFLASLMVSVYVYTKYPSTMNLIILLLFIPSFFLILRNIFKTKSKYGVVTDINKNRIEGVVVGLREMEFEKIVSKRVTDRLGRYRFVMNKGKYILEILDSGYKIEMIKGGESVSIEKNREEVIARDIVISEIKEE